MKLSMQTLTMALATVTLAACAGTGSTSSGDTLVVFHTEQGLFAVQKKKLSQERLKIVVENFFPSACTDDDADRDGVPDELDDDSDETEGDGSSCDSRDGGSRHTRDHGRDDSRNDGGVASSDDDGDDDRDGGDDDGEDDDRDDDGDGLTDRAHHCRVCNRGPGTQGDFRFEAKGTEGRLDRGRVVTRVGNMIQVPAPNGVVTILVDASTEVRGSPTPGSEIRVRGTLQGAASAMTIIAAELEVLCPGPTPMPVGDVPPEATPLDPTGSVPNDGGVPTIN